MTEISKDSKTPSYHADSEIQGLYKLQKDHS